MLVFTRKTGQRVLIGESVVVTVIACRNGVVRLGFEAPEDVEVFREEVFVKLGEALPSPKNGSHRLIKKPRKDSRHDTPSVRP